MGKEEIEKDAREVIGSADRKNHKPSFSDKVDQEFKDRKKAQAGGTSYTLGYVSIYGTLNV